MILGPTATPLARILEGAFFIYLIPVLVDFFVLDRLFRVQKKVRLFIAALLANAVAILSSIILIELFKFFQEQAGTQLSGQLINQVLQLSTFLLLFKMFVKAPVYWKMLSNITFKDVALGVLASTVIGNVLEALLFVGWSYFYLTRMAA